MLITADIPETFLAEALAIEARSNPYAWSANSLGNSFQHYQRYGAFIGTRLVAFILYQIVADEAEVIHLVCDQNEQGNGYAYQLFSQLIKTTKITHGVCCWHLEVRADNQAALRLYQRLGFSIVGQRKAYYQQRIDALLMRL